MRLHTVLIKPVSGACNMHCDYCFYCDEMEKRSISSYGMMSEKTLKNLVRKAMHQARGEICFAFQGGEPTLRGIDFYEKALELEQRFNRNQARVMNTIQTNGLGLNDEWCRFFKEHDFLVGVSVDGDSALHDRYRHDRMGEPTYGRVLENIKKLDEYGIEYNILTVVTAQAAERIEEIYHEYGRRGWKYQQYIACLDPLGEERGKREYSLTAELYGEFLIRLFRLWDKDWKRGRAPVIRQFENYIGILMGYEPEACEQRGICSVQCVAEADGSAYPCDFYVLDEYRLGNYNSDTIEDMSGSQNAVRFVRESLKTDPECAKCKWYSLCRGGCRRHRIWDEGSIGRNYFCGGYRMFFDKCADRMKEIAQYAKSFPAQRK
ncbi:MAG TPA: anaerobic sulfatase maturase [Candidatus Mediterraneibacter intestinigallinarum]|nr:anaerobic sulfatase maturase [Candidatus Mediterraneibacter intestinigallinarum]